MTINSIIEDVLSKEGDYVDHPNDRGGPTRYGITQAVARAKGYTGDMKALPREVAFEIYRGQYVVQPGFGLVSNLSQPIAAELVDTGVNMGPKIAAGFLQRALNLLTDFTLVQDGQIGERTLKALEAFLKRRGADGERRLLKLLNAFQGERYATLAEGRAENRAFIFGWLERI